jgi:two-component system, NarL family, sensor kinase
VSDPGERRRTALSLALMRAALVAVILVSEELIDARRLEDSLFWPLLGVAGGYSIACIGAALRGREWRLLTRVQACLDLLLLAAVTFTTGGAFSDVRKAFFVVPLAAAFTERERSTAVWSLLAVVVFTVQAVLDGGHPAGSQSTWQSLTLNQDIYLVWIGAAGTLLAGGLRRRTTRTEELARGRQRLVTQAIESVERERTRLAGALHDSPVQNLIAARHDLRRAERVGDAESFARLHEALDLTIAELREEIFNLHPHVLDHVGLGAALEQVARRHAVHGGAQVRIDVDPDLGPVHREVLFACGRELLGNAARHARASRIALTVIRESASVRLEVIDDGCGMPEQRPRHALLEGHIGLAEIRERVAALRGVLEIVTHAGTGTRIAISLPVATGDVSDRVTAVDIPRVSTA